MWFAGRLRLIGIAADYALLSAKRPFLLTGAIAAAAALLGAVAMIGGGLVLMSPVAAVVGAIFTVGGLLGCLLSLLGEYVQRIYRLSQGAPFYALRDDEERQPKAEPRRARSA